MTNDLTAVQFATNPDPRAPLVLVLDALATRGGHEFAGIAVGFDSRGVEVF
jgi:hypothetical protein